MNLRERNSIEKTNSSNVFWLPYVKKSWNSLSHPPPPPTFTPSIITPPLPPIPLFCIVQWYRDMLLTLYQQLYTKIYYNKNKHGETKTENNIYIIKQPAKKQLNKKGLRKTVTTASSKILWKFKMKCNTLKIKGKTIYEQERDWEQFQRLIPKKTNNLRRKELLAIKKMCTIFIEYIVQTNLCQISYFKYR